jgi:serine/threonine protein kinase/Tol biopolymer transport system component
MNPERWGKIGHLYHRALSLPPEERAAFLDQACSADPDLRREVESLIAALDQAEGFIARSALEDAAADYITEEVQPLTPKERIGHYVITRLLGTGGMGEVYLALDSRLGRPVALKLLPSDLEQDQHERKRLLREARAAAALNHPNIVNVYSIEEAGGRIFMVMEYVEGETLIARNLRKKLSFVELAEVGAQIANALAAAHAAGLVHRDIKPSNVLITEVGQVKLLDFGIAKMNPRILGRSDGADDTESYKTASGTIVGTVGYMSPEQVRGEELDGRSDIFSLGTVLYELATGRQPFTGPNSLAVAHEIVATEPRPPSALSQDLPPQFDSVIARALAKRREDRYQSASELAAALAKLKIEVGIGASSQVTTLRPDGAQDPLGRATAVKPGPVTATIALGSRTKAALRSVISHWRRTAGILAMASAALTGAGLLVGYYFFGQTRTAHNRVETPSAVETRLTNTGNIANARPAISPDGRYVAYAVLDTPKTSSLWVRQLATLSSTQIVRPAEVTYFAITFSRDGNEIYYGAREKNAQFVALYRMPVIGGVRKKIIEDVDGAVSFSPDGERFVFRRNFFGRGESALFVANADGSGEERIATLRLPDFFGEPSWSPDGKVIACAAGHGDGGDNRYVVQVSVGDWVMKPISSRKWRWTGSVEWLADGKGLLMIARDNAAQADRVWHLPYPEGEARRVTNNSITYSRMNLTADSRTMLAVHLKRSTSLWVVPADQPRAARKVTYGVGGFRSQLRWLSSGRIVFDSDLAATLDISIMNEDGSDQRELLGDLTERAAAGYPAVSPDERYIVFNFDRTGTRHIWRMDIDGSNLIRLTDGRGEDQPHCSSDGKWVVYTDIGSERTSLWKVPIEGGEPVQLTREGHARLASVSPDGRLIACFYSSEGSTLHWKLAILPSDGGTPVRTFPQRLHAGLAPKWTADGRALAYVDSSQLNIWLQPIDGGKPRQITDFDNDLIFGFEWAPDGKRLACVRGIWERDLVLVSNFK